VLAGRPPACRRGALCSGAARRRLSLVSGKRVFHGPAMQMSGMCHSYFLIVCSGAACRRLSLVGLSLQCSTDSGVATAVQRGGLTERRAVGPGSAVQVLCALLHGLNKCSQCPSTAILCCLQVQVLMCCGLATV
jgi:hypothetical protein